MEMTLLHKFSCHWVFRTLFPLGIFDKFDTCSENTTKVSIDDRILIRDDVISLRR